MTLIKSSEKSGPPPKELIDAIGQLTDESIKNGTLINTGGLAPTAASFRVRLSGGTVTVTDGPFTETKEVIGGYAVLELNSREEAIAAARHFMELHKQHWPGWQGETEVRQMVGPENCGRHP